MKILNLGLKDHIIETSEFKPMTIDGLELNDFLATLTEQELFNLAKLGSKLVVDRLDLFKQATDTLEMSQDRADRVLQISKMLQGIK